MKDTYDMKVSLQCIVCGGEDFSFNEDKTHVKCNLCNREYLGGYDELVELNSVQINNALEEKKNELLNDLKADMLKAFGGNKNIKIK
jgi:hypothetical protein